MNQYLMILLIISFISCSNNIKDIEVVDIFINKSNRIGIVKIRNNTDKNYYILEPVLSFYTDDLFHIVGKICFGAFRSREIRRIECEVYQDMHCQELLFSEVVLLPKKSVVSIEYEYDRELNVESKNIFLAFPANGYSGEYNKKKYLLFKKKLDSSNLIPGYEFYNKEIESFSLPK